MGSAREAAAGAEEAVGQLASAQQQQPRIQEAVVTRMPGTPLGIRLQPSSVGVFVEAVEENGIVWAWNAMHPEKKLAAGDRLIMVNGLQVANTWPNWGAVLTEMRRTTVTLVVVRAQLGQNGAGEETGPPPTLLAAQSNTELDYLLPEGFMDSMPRGTAAECGVTECAICFEDLEATEEVVLLPCKHVFHPSCAESWLTRVPTLLCARCPMCRQHLALQPNQQDEETLTTVSVPVAGTTVVGESAAAALEP